MNIPVVDFDVYRVGVEDVAEEKLDVLCKELRSAFTEVGFVYLKNTGISQYEVDTMMNISKTFFLLPHEAKMPFLRGKHADPNQGWVSSGTERLNSRRACDLKEAFNTSSLLPSMKWPSEEVLPGFREKQVWFYRRCADLSLRVLRVLALSLGLDPDFFLSKHSRVVDGEQQAGGSGSLWGLHCSSHHSWHRPRQHRRPDAEMDVRRLNFRGEAQSRALSLVHWYTVHRVLLPPPGDMSERQSVVFFLHPDDDAVITCCDGTDKYPAITALDYLMERLENSYRRK
ncbi:uncharacterized protein LOC133111947 isoform X4 [Conger conger]|uniref:uncharacterized protein LOC133111947 isoform X4 n=1 Tax=Conger conger TaxID=82655 RepID=UPI002A5B076C|nr:uncharacterized protein LOC133111947 isoform X4 [Conger conger]